MAALTVTTTSTTLLLMLLLQLSITTTATAACFRHHHRHLLHQPFFPVVDDPPTQAPSSSPSSPKPSQVPKMPFSSSTSSSSLTPPEEPFFPSIRPTPPPPSPTALTSFPANISSLLFPQTSSSSSSPHRHVIAITASVSVAAAAAILLAAAFLLHRRQQRKLDPADDDKASRTDSLRLFPPNTVASDEAHKLHHHSSAAFAPLPNRTSENFLYLGTLSTPKTNDEESAATTSVASSKFGSGSPYQRLGSPELTPLPPLPKINNSFRRSYKNELGGSDDDDDDKFFSPRGSSASPKNVAAGVMSKPVPLDSSVSPPLSYASRSVSPQLNLSPTSLKSSSSPDSIINFGAPLPTRPGPVFPASVTRSLSSSSTLSERVSAKDQNSPDFVAQMKKSLVRNNSAPKRFVPVRLPPPPPPPPPPPARLWEGEAPVDNAGPPVHVAPSSRARVLNGVALVKKNEEEESVERSEETTPRPKLKPLHWDKVRASSDRAMVWDQLKSSSFQLNEEMIETLFVVNNSSSVPKDHARRQILPSANEENRVLDPKKSQNIAILLRALNVTTDEVCEALLEGNTDTLGTELLESLLKMAPTKEEECKLREFKDESPFKLGPAEKFLQAVLDIPFAFKRVDAMLYIASFDSEVDYLKRSFETLEAACEELKNSIMFLKLLEAVLKTGNRMNVGTNRGDAHAFKLDTLLKLVDVKGADGKTTLLHFVVQEIIRAEGSRLSGTNQDDVAESSQQSSFWDEVEYRKRGLQVVSGLSGELINVKKAAGMDSDVLSNEVAKIAGGITKIAEAVNLIGGSALKESSHKFFESMDGFWKKAREEIVMIQAQEKLAFCMVKEITEYFHGNSTKEEAHPFRIFTVVRDFLSVLDQACKVVGKVNERTIVGSTRQFPVSGNPTLTAVFPGLGGKQHYGHPDDESSP